MSPSRIALARVLRAWVEWPGFDGSAEASVFAEIGAELRCTGFVQGTVYGNEPTTAGATLLAELDAHEKGGAS